MRMQLTSQQGNYIEQIVRDAQGQLVRVTFYVYQQGDRVRARIVHAVVLEAATFKARVLALGGKTAEKIEAFQLAYQHNFVSPFFNSFSLYLSGSKPRAPTIV